MVQSSRQLVLISGIPGTGKTYTGSQMMQNYGFTHYNIEELGSIPETSELQGDTVLTWGFVPDDNSIELVAGLVAVGFKLIWFDGNRPAALREFIKRGNVEEKYFYAQMYKIEESRVINRLHPIIVNTFDSQGDFRKLATIVDEILS